MSVPRYGKAVISAAQMFLDKVIMYPYLRSVFAILALPLEDGTEKVSYSDYAEVIGVREVTAGNSIDYDEEEGFIEGGEDGTVTWSWFTQLWDRQKTLRVGFIKEMNSILQGMSPSTVALIEAWWRKMGAEIDACVAATLYDAVPIANRFTCDQVGSTYKVDAENIIDTIIDFEFKEVDANVVEKVYVFAASDVMANISKDITHNYGLANDTVITLNPQVSQDVADRLGEKTLAINIKVTKVGHNMYVLTVPKDRMNSKIVLNDGKTPGQEEGGFTPAINEPGYCQIKLLFVPESAAFVGIRHLVSNITIPKRYEDLVGTISNSLDGLNGDYYGTAMIQNIGVDQQGDQFKSMNRVRHGAGVFNNYKHSLFAITTTPVAYTPTVTAMSVDRDIVASDGGSVKVTLTGTQLTNGLTVAAFDESTQIEDSGTALTAGTETSQVATIVLPKNEGEAEKEYTIKFSVNGTLFNALITKTVEVNEPAVEPGVE